MFIVTEYAALNTLDIRQSKTLLTIDERGSKIVRNSVVDCHFGKWQSKTVSNDF